MKTIILILLTTSMMMLGSCSKDKPSKPQEHFIKTIQCTYPETYTNRHSTFTYDDNNRIKEFKFYMTGQTVSATFSYNQDDLITQIDELWTNLTTGNETLRLIEFRYAGSTLNEYISDGTSYLVTYEPVTNSYKVLDNIFSLNAHKNLMKMDRDEGFRVTNKLTIHYTSGKGVFRPIHSQIGSYILAERLFIYYLSDVYAFSQNEISAVTENGTAYTYVSVRDENGNIVQTDIKKAGTLIKRYLYTYELRNVE